jgi:hypothetical protein
MSEVGTDWGQASPIESLEQASLREPALSYQPIQREGEHNAGGYGH